MSLMRPFSSLREDIDRIFSEMEQGFVTPWWGTARRRMEPSEMAAVWIPPVDVIEEDENIKVRAQVPGIKPEDIDIEVQNDSLLISGETIYKEEEEKGNICRREIARGKFCRRVEFPTDVQSEKAKADFKDGMLTVTVPKSEQVRRHRIKVSK